MQTNELNIYHRNIINKFYEAGYITWPETKHLLKQLNDMPAVLFVILDTAVEGRKIRYHGVDAHVYNNFSFSGVGCLEICGDFMIKYDIKDNTFKEFTKAEWEHLCYFSNCFHNCHH